MKRFFEVTFRPFFVLTGVGTSLAGLYALWPRWAVETLGKLTFRQDYTVFVQHWGVMVGLMGLFMIVAAFNVKWRKPILVCSLVEKSFMVFLVAMNLRQTYAQGLKALAAMDAAVVLYTILYFGVLGLRE